MLLQTTEATTKDTDETNMGLKIVSGDLSLIVSQGTYEAVTKTETTKVHQFLTRCQMV